MTTKPAKTRTTINLPTAIHTQIVAEAEANERSVASQITFMLRQQLNQKGDQANG